MPVADGGRTLARMTLATPRLDLVPATAPLLLAEMNGPEDLGRMLGARVGPEWPPPLYDADTLEWSLDQVRADPRFEAWGMRYVVARESDRGGPEAVGVAGFKGPPVDGRLEVGYSILPSYHRRGFATEAVLALVDHAFGTTDVDAVVAHTLAHLVPSIGVLLKAGFRFDGESDEDGVPVVRYLLHRSSAT